MAVSESYLAFVLGQLEGLRGVVTKRMFGGVGIYSDGLFFAVIDNDTLFFKVDDELRPRYRSAGMSAFAPMPGKPAMEGAARRAGRCGAIGGLGALVDCAGGEDARQEAPAEGHDTTEDKTMTRDRRRNLVSPSPRAGAGPWRVRFNDRV
jgi:hypothetical protein